MRSGTRRQERALPEAEGARGAYVRPATVVDVAPEAPCACRVCLDAGGAPIPAELAAFGGYRPAPGDRVVVAGEDGAACYLIGVLSAAAPAPAPAVATRDGASVGVTERDGRDVLELRDPAGQVIASYDPAAARLTLIAPAGDLALHAPAGHIDLVAARGVRCVSAGEVSVQSASGVTLSARSPAGGAPAAVRVDPEQVTLAGERLGVAARRADLRVAEGRYTGEGVSAVVQRVELTLGRIETVAERVLSRARSAFHQVEELHQLRAGRARALIAGAFQLHARSASLDADEDVRIDGDKINLG